MVVCLLLSKHPCCGIQDVLHTNSCPLSAVPPPLVLLATLNKFNKARHFSSFELRSMRRMGPMAEALTPPRGLVAPGVRPCGRLPPPRAPPALVPAGEAAAVVAWRLAPCCGDGHWCCSSGDCCASCWLLLVGVPDLGAATLPSSACRRRCCCCCCRASSARRCCSCWCKEAQPPSAGITVPPAPPGA